MPFRFRHCRKERRFQFEHLETRQLLSAVTLLPVADTVTHAGVNAGTATMLATRDRNGAGGDYMAYIRFDLSGVDLTGLTNAYLNLQKIGGATIVSGRFDVFGLADLPGNTPQNWSEATLAETGAGAEYTNTSGNYIDLARVVNLNSEDTAGANVIEQVTGSGTSQFLSGVDLVNFLRARKTEDGQATFIVLVDAGQDRELDYGSRENADPDLRPKLELDFVPAYAGNPVNLPQQVEDLDRGLIALRRATSQVYLGWRMLGTDPVNVGFNVYRSSNGGSAVKLNSTPITNSTNYVDTTFPVSSTNAYYVRPIINGVEQAASETFSLQAFASIQQYLNVPLQIPPGGLTPDWQNPGQSISYTYSANDATVADLDGDGAYEIILKWKASNEPGAGSGGFAAPPIVDAYKLDGTRLWRINLGINVRSIRSFLAYDLDGDGKSELVLRTAPGTTDGSGHLIAMPGDDPNADYRDAIGVVTTGPEYLTVFDGATGAEITSTSFLPDRQDIMTWGDDYGRRDEGIALTVAYIDGSRPSIIVGRGIYGPASNEFSARNELTAWNWRNGSLDLLWWFKADVGIENVNSQYVGQGSHGISIADVDGDGKDEIIYGAMTIDDDGTGLYSTGLGHGDALHVSDMDPSNPGLEIFMAHEGTGIGDHKTSPLRDAATGAVLATPYVSAADIAAGSFPDVGRGVAMDIDPNYPGYEFWNSYNSDIYDAHGNVIYAKPSNMFTNSGVWWDADLSRELLDGTTISEWNNPGRSNIVSYGQSGINGNPGVTSNNDSKQNACLSGDILGDWREEVIWRTDDDSALQIWSTTITTDKKLYTLVHDVQYREALAWQNVGYNQPPHPSFWLGEGMPAQEQPLIYLAGHTSADFNSDGDVDGGDFLAWQRGYGTQAPNATKADGDAEGDLDVDGDDLTAWQSEYGQQGTIVAVSTGAAAVTTNMTFTTAEAAWLAEPYFLRPPAPKAVLPVDDVFNENIEVDTVAVSSVGLRDVDILSQGTPDDALEFDLADSGDSADPDLVIDAAMESLFEQWAGQLLG